MAFLNAPSDIMILPAFSKAFLTVEDNVYTLSVGDDEAKPYFFEQYSNCAASDLLGFTVPRNTPEEALRTIVQREKDRRDILFFFLASFDRSLSFEVREEAASLVEALLADQELYQYAEEILLSEPFRPTQDAPFELSFPALEKYAGLFSVALAHQSAATLFWRAWDMMAKETDPLSLTFALDSLRDLLLSLGVTSRFIRSIYAADSRAFNNELVDLTLHTKIREEFGAAPRLLTRLRNLLDRLKAFDDLQMSFEGAASQDNEEDAGEAPLVQHGRTLFGHEIYSQITKQISSIGLLLISGSQALAEKAVRELLAFQRLHSAPEYLAMTLCNLAKIAIASNEIHIAKRLSDEAVALGVHDVVVDSTAAEVMKNLGQFAEAKSRYEAALMKYGGERYLLNGLADVLKDIGEFEAALSLYEQTEGAFPDDPVAPNGISTVYFAMNHPQQALAKAQKNVAMFGDEVSRVICGNILRHLGRNHESLALMQETVSHFPREMMAWNGYIRSLSLVGRHHEALKKCEDLVVQMPDVPMPRFLHGDLLRKIGKLPESLLSFNRSLVQFPSHRGLQMGKAAVLLLQGNALEAVELTKISNPQSELDWRMFHVFSSALVRGERYEEALSSLEWGLTNVPWRKLESLFSDTIGYVKLRTGKAQEAIEEFRKGLKTADKAKRNGLCLLLGRAYLEIGRPSDAARYLSEVVSFDPPVMELKSATQSGLHLVQGSGLASLRVVENEFQMLLAAA